jgi:hypothetical protein
VEDVMGQFRNVYSSKGQALLKAHAFRKKYKVRTRIYKVKHGYSFSIIRKSRK